MQVINNLCKGCGLCVHQCPFGAIEVIDKLAYFKDTCTNCGICAQACKFKAIVGEQNEVTPSEKDISNYHGIWVFAEQRRGILTEVARELLGIASELASQRQTYVAAVLLGENITELSQELIAYGADKVYVVENPELRDYRTEPYADVLAALAQKGLPEAILLGATHIGRDLAPRLACRLGTGLTADCISLSIDPDEGILLQTRPAFGGNLMATIACPKHRPQMSTVRPGVMKKLDPDYNRQGEIIEVPHEIPSQSIRTKVIEIIEAAQSMISLEEAEIIIAGGRGIGSMNEFQELAKVAQLLGATLGASRGAVDAGWIDHQHQVGQTGKTVKPKLYIACGISGAIQHVAGMEKSGCIVAINNDPNAPIFSVADYSIIGDIKEVLPVLVQQLQAVS